MNKKNLLKSQGKIVTWLTFHNNDNNPIRSSSLGYSKVFPDVLMFNGKRKSKQQQQHCCNRCSLSRFDVI